MKAKTKMDFKKKYSQGLDIILQELFFRNPTVMSSQIIPKLALKYFALFLAPILKKSMMCCEYSSFYTVTQNATYYTYCEHNILKSLVSFMYIYNSV